MAVRYDVERLDEDMAARGWQPIDLARHANVSRMTVSRWRNGDVQTARTTAKLAAAMGYSPRRYLVRRAA